MYLALGAAEWDSNNLDEIKKEISRRTELTEQILKYEKEQPHRKKAIGEIKSEYIQGQYDTIYLIEYERVGVRGEDWKYKQHLHYWYY